jgi:hypothetical protein
MAGFPNTSIQAWWFGPDYAGSLERIDGDDARRIRSQYLSDDQGLVTMALATRGTNFCKPDVVRYESELAKELMASRDYLVSQVPARRVGSRPCLRNGRGTTSDRPCPALRTAVR